MQQELVSIIMPLYNASQFIEASIQSILNQTFRDWELLITDDCSTDNSCEIVERYAAKDSRVKLFRLEQNSGAAVARNRSIEMSKGRYLAFCDSDDRWMSSKLQKQIEWMIQRNIEVSYSSYIECDEKNINLGIMVAPPKVAFKDIVKCDYMGFLTFIYDTKRIGKIEMPNLRKRQDWALKLKIMQLVEYAEALPEPLAYYRVRRGSLSQNKWNLVKYNLDVYEKVLKYSHMKAWMTFSCKFMPHYISKRLKCRLTNNSVNLLAK